jgi:hypothetical protein
MVLQEIEKIFEKRKTELITLLESDSKTITLEKQHQVYGAINEIDIFLRTLSYYKVKQLEPENCDIKLVKPNENKGLLSGLFKESRDDVVKNK